ncbi:hypothetical protein [Teichococcus aestuarii]|uniref:hypothetical protein n=1 Tax=Teichococcus aestuarii TaxID=568898 RepID=UPI0015E80EEA|nr:hypothetical protein [Pseudoroseomonas aestuarii]
MSDAKFEVGQAVAFGRGTGDAHIPAGDFTITRVMPQEGGFRSYRVRGKDGVERVMQESQLRPASGSGASQTGQRRAEKTEVWPT